MEFLSESIRVITCVARVPRWVPSGVKEMKPALYLCSCAVLVLYVQTDSPLYPARVYMG